MLIRLPRDAATEIGSVLDREIVCSMPPLVDIHCHPLPELDDGAKNWDEALAMARIAVEDGIACIVATPHQLGATRTRMAT